MTVHAADLLDRAAALEKDGKNEDARSLYLQWLSKPDSSDSGSFGRILIHTLRMPAPLDEDLSLINKHLNRINSVQDKRDILRTAVILSELSGDNILKQKYLSSMAALDAGNSGTASDETISRLTGTSDIKYEYIAALKEKKGSPELLLWIDRAHREHPPLYAQADWLYQLQKVLGQSGYESQAAMIRQKILNDFPASIEASLLNNEISLLAEPGDLVDGAEPSGSDEHSVYDSTGAAPADGAEGAADEERSAFVEYTLFQTGIFRNYDNASRLKSELEAAGLVSIIEKDNDSFRVIVESRNDALSREIFNRKGIKAFRIHP